MAWLWAHLSLQRAESANLNVQCLSRKQNASLLIINPLKTGIVLTAASRDSLILAPAVGEWHPADLASCTVAESPPLRVI